MLLIEWVDEVLYDAADQQLDLQWNILNYLKESKSVSNWMLFRGDLRIC